MTAIAVFPLNMPITLTTYCPVLEPELATLSPKDASPIALFAAVSADPVLAPAPYMPSDYFS